VREGALVAAFRGGEGGGEEGGAEANGRRRRLQTPRPKNCNKNALGEAVDVSVTHVTAVFSFFFVCKKHPGSAVRACVCACVAGTSPPGTGAVWE